MDKKPFSKEDYKESDKNSKIISSKFLLWDGRFVLDVPLDQQSEQYKKNDFVVKLISSGKIVQVETERKIKGWTKSGKWEGWKTLDVPYRKKDSEADIFIMHNESFNTLAVVMMKKVLNSNVSRKDAKCSNVNTKQEKFFNVDLKHVRFFKCLDNKREKWIEITPDGDIKVV